MRCFTIILIRCFPTGWIKTNRIELKYFWANRPPLVASDAWDQQNADREVACQLYVRQVRFTCNYVTNWQYNLHRIHNCQPNLGPGGIIETEIELVSDKSSRCLTYCSIVGRQLMTQRIMTLTRYEWQAARTLPPIHPTKATVGLQWPLRGRPHTAVTQRCVWSLRVVDGVPSLIVVSEAASCVATHCTTTSLNKQCCYSYD